METLVHLVTRPKEPKMQDLDLTSLRLYLAVCDTRSLLKVARAENLVSSAISKRIGKLEELAGHPLLKRIKHGVEPTHAGLEFAEMARGLLQSAQDMVEKVSHLRAGDQGTIYLMANANLIGGVLTQDLSDFLNLPEHREIDIQLQEGQESQSIVNLLRDGSISLGLIWDRINISGLECLPYRTTRLVLVTHKSHPLANSTKLAMADCMHYDFIGMRTTRMVEAILRRSNMLTGKPAHFRAEVWTLEAALRMIGANLGISVMSEDVATPYAILYDLALIPLTDRWATRNNSIVFKDEKLLTPASQLLVNFLTKKSALPVLAP